MDKRVRSLEEGPSRRLVCGNTAGGSLPAQRTSTAVAGGYHLRGTAELAESWGVIAQYSGDVEYWNSGGDGYKALMLADLAVRLLEGKNVTMEEYTDVINSRPGLVIQECANCGSEVEDEDMDGDLCEWCQADAQGFPYGRCPDCSGARAQDRSCACRPRRSR